MTRAEQLRDELAELVYEYVSANEGVTNAEVAQAMKIESGFEGAHRNYFSHALLSRLVEAGRLQREKVGSRVRYRRI